MAVKKKNKEKHYNGFVKFIAVVLPFIAFLWFLGSIGASEMDTRLADYRTYSKWEIVSAESEQTEDGRFLITAEIKNSSSYKTSISNYSITVYYGNNSRLNNELKKYPDGYFYDTLNETYLPAGQTIKYKMLVAPPEGVNTVTLSYNGLSYDLRELLGGDHSDTSLTVKLY